MRCAPSVVYPVGRSGFHGLMILVLASTSLVLLLSWGWTASMLDQLLWWVVLSAWAAWCWWVSHAWRNPVQGTLEWDPLTEVADGCPGAGQWIWCCSDESQACVPCAVHVVADWQSGLLLRLSHRGGSTWVWAERGCAASRWLEFRRALTFAGDA
jgi:hypothetical protein